jgi:hypothetical protein
MPLHTLSLLLRNVIKLGTLSRDGDLKEEEIASDFKELTAE